MRRIDLIYEKLKEIGGKSGITAIEISEILGLDRSNVSSDLNRLHEEGKVTKSTGRPILFSIAENVKGEKKENIFDKFSEKNPSLTTSVDQAKAAVLYPSKKMHMLILGETGVGKSMFAGLVHRYAKEMKVMDENSPFITFNCADYASNPQLLISQLFGNKKGAYTGADYDKEGLIEKADKGILFLDEVHRLPPEGQEMFFTFMDNGCFRRLGETDLERNAKVLIIAATTENPGSTLLKTFTRRIPMIINIPSLEERSFEEKFNLIKDFIMEESASLGRKIVVSVNSLRAFLSYRCVNNIGQLKTDVQIVCAKAYAEFVSGKKEDIIISSLELPYYIREGLYTKIEHRQLFNKLIGINKRYCVFDKTQKDVIFVDDDKNENIYKMIDLRVHELRSRGIQTKELEKEMERDIEDYFTKYIHTVNTKIDTSNLESIIEPEIIRLVEELISFCEESLGKSLSKKIYYGMAVHISNSIDRIKRKGKIVNPQLNKIRTEFPQEFEVALDCLKIIEKTLDISIPIDEAAFLAMFLVYDDKTIREERNDVKVIVVAHGLSTATSMAHTANMLLGVNYAVGIDAPLIEKPHEVISRIKAYIKETKIKSDILFLVDMGSLINFGKEIENEIGNKTKTMPLVSTLHVIEATRKAMIGYALEEVYKETLEVNTFLEKDDNEIEEDVVKDEKLAIVTICTTGEGSAIAIQNILKDKLKIDENIFNIIPVNLIGKESIYERLKNISKENRIVCIVSHFNIDTKIPQFDLAEILSLDAIPSIQRLIDIETTYIKIGDTLENQLENVGGKSVLKDIKKFISNIEEELNAKINTNALIGITFHMAAVIERLKKGEKIDEFEDKDRYIQNNRELYSIVRYACTYLENQYDIKISDDEVCYISTNLNYKNYTKL